MKLFQRAKDGGPDSHVWGFFFIEIKWLFTIALLCFEEGTREAYHDHAFNCWSIILGPGYLEEKFLGNQPSRTHRRGRFLITRRKDFHKVRSHGRTWVFTIRGPWTKRWKEYQEGKGFTVLTHGRKVVS